MIAQGELPHFRVGKLIRIPEKFIEEYEQCLHSNSNSDEKEYGVRTNNGKTERCSFRTRSRELAEQRLTGLQDQSKQPKDGSLASIYTAYRTRRTPKEHILLGCIGSFLGELVPNTTGAVRGIC